MNEDNKQEFLKFLKTKGPKQSLNDIAFGLLCLSYDENKKRKPHISFVQEKDAPVFNSILIIDDKQWHFSTLVGDIIKELE